MYSPKTQGIYYLVLYGGLLRYPSDLWLYLQIPDWGCVVGVLYVSCRLSCSVKYVLVL